MPRSASGDGLYPMGGKALEDSLAGSWVENMAPRKQCERSLPTAQAV